MRRLRSSTIASAPARVCGYVPAGLCGDEVVLDPRHEVEFARELGLDVRGHLRSTVYHVPLVHRQRQPDLRLERVAGDVHVLRGDALGRVGHEDGDIGPLERVGRAR
jgi:hypothetical protein